MSYKCGDILLSRRCMIGYPTCKKVVGDFFKINFHHEKKSKKFQIFFRVKFYSWTLGVPNLIRNGPLRQIWQAKKFIDPPPPQPEAQIPTFKILMDGMPPESVFFTSQIGGCWIRFWLFPFICNFNATKCIFCKHALSKKHLPVIQRKN